MREEIVIVCVGLRWDAGRACQVVAKISKCSRHGTHWSALSSIVAPCLLTFYELFTQWHDNFVMTSRGTLEKIFNISKFSPRHGTHYFTWHASPRISTHTVTSSSLIVPPWSLCMYTNLTIFIYISPMGSGRRLVVSTSIPHIFPHAVVYLGLLTSVFQFIIFM